MSLLVSTDIFGDFKLENEVKACQRGIVSHFGNYNDKFRYSERCKHEL